MIVGVFQLQSSLHELYIFFSGGSKAEFPLNRSYLVKTEYKREFVIDLQG